MPATRSDIGIEVGTKVERLSLASDDKPFQILFLANLTGAGAKTGNTPSRPVFVDRDNFDEVLGRFRPAVELRTPGGPAATIHFRDLDDFHPEQLVEQVPWLRQLRNLRRELADPGTFPEAFRRLRNLEEPAPKSAPPKPAGGGGSLLQQMLENAQPVEPEPLAAAHGDLQDYINRIMAPHLAPRPDARQPEVLAEVDRELQAQLRAVLHDAGFQALESAWRSVFFLIRRLETGVNLKVAISDYPREAMETDLGGASDLRQTGFWRTVTGQGRSEPNPWAVVAADYQFGPAAGDINLLARVAMIAGGARTAFVGGAAPSVLGLDTMAGASEPEDWPGLKGEPQEFWKLLRGLEEAPYLGLALPRVLLRLPYGKETSEVEGFPFEEVDTPPRHQDYLWGSSAALCACLLGQAFIVEGWDMRPGRVNRMGGFPLHIYWMDSESFATPCAEALLNDEAMKNINERGLISILSAKAQDMILVPGLRSVADPPQPLHGPWSTAI